MAVDISGDRGAEPALKTIGQKVAAGAAWMVSMRLAVRLIGLVSTLILVRLLDPQDFGIVAMAMSIVAAVELVMAFGFDIALIQNQDAGPDDYNTAWTLNVLLGSGASLLLLAVAFPAAAFYEEPRLVAVFAVLATASLLQGLENIALVNFRKDLDFAKEFAFRLSLKLVAFVVTVSLAFALRSYWALVIGIVTSRFAATAMSHLILSYRPKFSLAALDKIMHFSKWLFLNNVTQVARMRGPDFVIGKIAGATGLGFFSIAQEISNLPTTELVAPVNRALFPGFSKISKDPDKARRALVQVASLLALISLPVGFGIAVTSHLITPLLLGDKWLAAIPLIRILAIVGALIAIQSPITTVLVALGNPRVVSIMSVANLFVLLPLLVFLTQRDGISGSATALLISAALFLPVNYAVAGRLIGLRARDFRTMFLRPAIAVAVMYTAVHVNFGQSAATVSNIALAASLGAAVYVAVISVAWLVSSRPARSAEAYLFEVVSRFVRK